MQLLTAVIFTPTCLAFSPDGRLLVAADRREVHLWDLAAGQRRWYRVRPIAPGLFAFTADGTGVVCGHGHSFQRHDAVTGDAVYVPSLGHFKPVRLSPCGRFALAWAIDDATRSLSVCLACATGDEWAEAWRRDVAFDPRMLGRGGHHELHFSADGRRSTCVWAASPLGAKFLPTGVEVYESSTGDRVAAWSGELPKWSNEVASPTGTVVFFQNQALVALDPTAEAKSAKRFNASPKHFTAAAFSRDGSKLVTTSNDTAATVWDATTWEVRKRYEWGIGPLRSVCFSPDGLRCAAGGDKQIVVWDVDD